MRDALDSMAEHWFLTGFLVLVALPMVCTTVVGMVHAVARRPK